MEKHHESTEPESSETVKMFFFFLLSSDGLAQRCVNFSRWFTHETAAFYTEQCTTPSLLHNIEVSQGARSYLLKKTMASTLEHHFLHLYGACALQDHLATTQNELLKVAKLEIQCMYIPYVIGVHIVLLIERAP